ncbi:MAG: hypothetical protein R2865_08875 [Deinococcales bacterium]
MRDVESLKGLRGRLEQARQRWRWLEAFKLFIWLLLGMLMVFLSLQLLHYLVWPLAKPLLSSLSLLLLGLILIILKVFIRSPSLLKVASLADVQFQLYEQSSTALELLEKPQLTTSPLLRQAILAKAENLVSEIKVAELFVFKWPKSSYALLVLVPLSLLSLFLPQAKSMNISQASQESLLLNEVERLDLSQQLGQTAELLKEEAEASQDPYLQALAQAFQELGSKLERGELSKADLELELNRLMRHLDKAYQPQGQASDQGQQAQASNQSSAANPSQDDEALAEGHQKSNREESAEENRATLGVLLEQLSKNQQDLKASQESREASKGMITIDREKYASPMTPEAYDALKDILADDSQKSAEIVGAAQESSAGEGDVAGEGSESLEGAASLMAKQALAADQEMLLPSLSLEGGEVIKVERLPEMNLSQVIDESPLAKPSWQGAQETELRHDWVLPRDRALLSRYFTREKLPQE